MVLVDAAWPSMKRPTAGSWVDMDLWNLYGRESAGRSVWLLGRIQG